MWSFFVRDMIRDAVQIPDTIWDFYIYLKEKHKFKISHFELTSIIKQSTSCGRRHAQILRQIYNGISIHELAEKQKVELIFTNRIEMGNKIVFAVYEEPNIIKISSGLVKDAKNLIVSEQLVDIIDPNVIEDILIAHELYHMLESVNEKNIYTRKCYFITRRWPLKKRVRLLFASELGAMAFAKEWLSLSYHPCVLDILLTQVIDPSLASSIYRDVKVLQMSDTYKPHLHFV